jgi:hypothetical protein
MAGVSPMVDVVDHGQRFRATPMWTLAMGLTAAWK